MRHTPPLRSPRLRIRPLAVAAAVLLAVPVLAAVTDRYFFEVPRENASRLDGRFDLALGSVTIGEAERGTVFQAEVLMEDERLRPEMNVDRRGGEVTVRLGFEQGKEGRGVSVRGLRSRNENEWHLFFDRRTPLRLQFDLGLSEADLDLTGFRVERLAVNAGMARARLAFHERNPVEMERLAIDAGAAQFAAEGLGNARFREMTFKGGAGSFDLDFTGGPLPRGARAHVEVGVSRLRVRLPEDKAVVLHAPESWLARVEVPIGYTRAGRGVWHSATVGDPDAAFHLTVNAGMGRVICETVASE